MARKISLHVSSSEWMAEAIDLLEVFAVQGRKGMKWRGNTIETIIPDGHIHDLRGRFEAKTEATGATFTIEDLGRVDSSHRLEQSFG